MGGLRGKNIDNVDESHCENTENVSDFYRENIGDVKEHNYQRSIKTELKWLETELK